MSENTALLMNENNLLYIKHDLVWVTLQFLKMVGNDYSTELFVLLIFHYFIKEEGDGSYCLRLCY